MRVLTTAQPVVELSHDAAAKGRAELAERTRAFRDGHREQSLACFADLGTLSDEPQPIEIDVGAAQHRHKRLVANSFTRNPGLQARDREGAGWLHDAARVVEYVLDCRADFIVTDPHDLVDSLADDRKGQLAHLAYSDTLGKDTDMVQRHALSGLQRPIHGICLVGLHADHLHIFPELFEIARDPRDEAATADGYEHRRQPILAVTQDLRANGSLSRNHQWIVKGMNERQP